jgi:ketosteroid isomerase-like protein
MEAWEPGAREAIRELVARYTHWGDGGRIKEMTELFEPDAVVEAIGTGTFAGHEAMAGFFGGLADRTVTDPDVTYIRHHVANLTISFDSPTEATGAAYWLVVNDHGPVRWGRYRDAYRQRPDGEWRFARRQIRADRQAS